MTPISSRISKTKIGWILILFGLLLLSIMSYITFPAVFRWFAIERQTAKAKGVVTEIKPLFDSTGALITFRFEVPNADGTVGSYTNSQNALRNYSTNSEVSIEYAASNPAYCRIEGESSELLPRVFVAVGFIPAALVAIYAGIRTIRSGKRQKRSQAEARTCPYCGAKLRTSAAKQCSQCKKDWHDETLGR